MYKFFVCKNQINNNIVKIINDDVNHIKNVLRLSTNNNIEISNSDNGKSYLCKIIKIQKDIVECQILNQLKQTAESSIHLNILQGIPKSDKMELIIQKCTELGAKEITPVSLNRCIVKLNEKDESKKIERWQKIAECSAKQCKRDIIPRINNVINLEKVIDLIKNYDIIIVAYEEENKNEIKQELQKIVKKDNLKIGILIGPEGGLEKEEIEILKENGAKIVSLGNRILRTETAPIVLTTIIMYEFSQM